MATSTVTLSDDVWLRILDFVLAECFSLCAYTSLVPDHQRANIREGRAPYVFVACDHPLGICTDPFLLQESKSRIAKLAGVSRHLSLLLRPFLFRVLIISDARQRQLEEESTLKAATKTLKTTRLKVDALRARPDLCVHVQVAVFKSLRRWEAWNGLHPAADETVQKSFISALKELNASMDSLFRKMPAAQVMSFDDSDLSPGIFEAIRQSPSLHSLSFVDWVYPSPLHVGELQDALDNPRIPSKSEFSYGDGSTSLLTLQNLTLSAPALLLNDGEEGPGLVVNMLRGLVNYTHPDGQITMRNVTALHLTDALLEVSIVLEGLQSAFRVPSMGDDETPITVFPALRSLRFSGLNTPPTNHPARSLLQKRLRDFMTTHRTIQDLQLHTFPGGRGDNWIRDIFNSEGMQGDVTDTSLLPNLVAFTGSLYTARELARGCKNLTEFKLSLEWNGDSDRYVRSLNSLARSTQDRVIDLHLSLTAEQSDVPPLNFGPGALYTDMFRPVSEEPVMNLVKSIPKNVQRLNMVVVEPVGHSRDAESLKSMIETINPLISSRLQHLRSVEISIWTLTAIRKSFCDSTDMMCIDGEKVRRLRPQRNELLHPVTGLVKSPYTPGNEGSLEIHEHEVLERVRILTKGTWVWSDRLGWEYCK